MDKKWKIIFDYLMHLIRENKVKPGEVLPSQNMLKTKYKFSEQPIRIAFNKLIELQLIKAVNGKGYVVLNKLQNNVLFSFREMFPNAKSEYFDLEEIIVDAKLGKLTKFYEGEYLIKFKCIRKDVNNNVIVYQESFIPKNLFISINANILNQHGLMHFIENHTDIKASHSSKAIYYKTLDTGSYISNFFNNKNLQNFIVDEGNLYGIYGENIEYRISYYNPEFFNWKFIEWRK